MRLEKLRKSWLRRTRACTSRQGSRFRPRLETLEDRMLLSTLQVTNLNDSSGFQPGDGTLRGEIAAAQNGDIIQFNSSLTGGTVILGAGQLVIGKSLTITGLTNSSGGPAITIDGNNASRIFDVQSSGSLTVTDLKLSGGLAKGHGEAAEGGAIYSSGKLTLTDVRVTNNKAQGSSGFLSGEGVPAKGGGLYVAAGIVKLNKDTFSSNIAQGGIPGKTLIPITGGSTIVGGPGGNGYGGGLYVASGTVTLNNDKLSSNEADGGSSAEVTQSYSSPGGNGYGGGLYAASGTIALNNDRLSSNKANGGNGGAGTLFKTIRKGNVSHTVRGISGNGGNGYGGGLYAAGATIVLGNDVLNANDAKGGNGGQGGGNASRSGQSGHSGFGGKGSGGGVYLSKGSVTLTNNTLYGNIAQGGSGGSNTNTTLTTGAGGNGSGGGLYVGTGTATLTNDTLSGNKAQKGRGGLQPDGKRASSGSDSGGGLKISANAVSTSLIDTLIAQNSGKGPDVFGNVSYSDHDLIGDGTDSNLLNGASGDRVGSSIAPIDPLLGSLANNGGPTQTMALLQGSPAIDAGDLLAVASATDQRGYARIVDGGKGNSIDIGAYEYAAVPADTDLALISHVDSTAMNAGGQLTYTLTVTNKGSQSQSDITLFDALPAHTSGVSFTVPSGWNSGAGLPFGANHNTAFAWSNNQVMAAGASVTFTLVVQINSGTAAGTIIRNTASVGPTTGDPKRINNSGSSKTTVLASAPVQLSMNIQPQPPTYNATLGEWEQSVSITAVGFTSNVRGPLALMLTGLPSGVTLANATGKFEGNPYLEFVPADGSLPNNDTVTVTLYYKAPQSAAINPDFEVWQGL